ncbi:hypothetical protein [Plantactinospora sp. B24E8]|uniref:hypothetical protein n=1 Tax=Plantactinospora sp. B24E8 TaxID=3153567 RepID=UPI00325C50F8
MTDRYVVHVPFTASDPTAARRFARTAARTLDRLPQVDVAEATVSAEDNQGVQSRLFCDRLLSGGRRCVLRAKHETPCGTVESEPDTEAGP